MQNHQKRGYVGTVCGFAELTGPFNSEDEKNRPALALRSEVSNFCSMQ
jgi:hypothetical protein